MQERSLVRQRYIVKEGRGEVVGSPSAVVGERPLKHPPEERQLKAESQAIRGEMPQFHQHEGLSRSYWHEDSRPDQEETNFGFKENQEDKIQLRGEGLEL